jgi:nitroimidazol reductase NimA-like FMN-containing flavoprotein (pyridoxamine 5'-phosphate oxidase superfamily)
MVLPWGRDNGRMSEPEALTYDKCVELLRGAIVGRVAFNVPEGPRIIPVNYTTVGDAVVFRTTPESMLGTYAEGPLAFEIDHVDYSDQKGWSVLATGVGELVDDVRALAEEADFWNPRPWAEVTGRRLGGGWTHDNELPVRRR